MNITVCVVTSIKMCLHRMAVNASKTKNKYQNKRWKDKKKFGDYRKNDTCHIDVVDILGLVI